jgi:hypothetical protein
MKTVSILSGFALMCAAAASAQTTGAATSQPGTQTTASSNAAQTVTLSGCVGSMSGSQGGFMLSNPIVIPSSAQPGTPTAGISSAPSSSATPTTQPAPTSPTSAGVGTAGTASTGVGTAGTAGTMGTTGMNGYRLSGTDMSSWTGRRVQIVGVVAPATTGSTANTGINASAGTTGQTLLEFRVQSVQPITGSCPQQ